MHGLGLYNNIQGGIKPAPRASTLIMYVFSNTDLEYRRNLQFFIHHGMWEDDGCEYVIIVQQVGMFYNITADLKLMRLFSLRVIRQAMFSTLRNNRLSLKRRHTIDPSLTGLSIMSQWAFLCKCCNAADCVRIGVSLHASPLLSMCLYISLPADNAHTDLVFI